MTDPDPTTEAGRAALRAELADPAASMAEIVRRYDICRTALPAALDALEAAQADGAKLRIGIQRAADWFNDDADDDDANGATEKAERSRLRADICTSMIATPEGRGND